MALKEDLALICCGGAKVHASSVKLIDASRNIPFKEIIATAMSERQGSEMAVLPVPGDTSTAWSACTSILLDSNTKWLNRENLAEVLKVADKYELIAVLEFCQEAIVGTALPTVGDLACNSCQEISIQLPCKDDIWDPLSLGRSIMYEGLVDMYVDIAILLHRNGMRSAYRAFVCMWFNGLHKIIRQRQQQQQQQQQHRTMQRRSTAESSSYFMQRLCREIKSGPSEDATLQLMTDLCSVLGEITCKPKEDEGCKRTFWDTLVTWLQTSWDDSPST